VLKQKLLRRAADAVELGNVRVEAASFRKLRGPTYIGIEADELAFFFADDWHQNTDVEVLNAARPGLMTTTGPLIRASSPYAKRGVLWSAYKKHFGLNGSPSVLIAKGRTVDFNPNISQEELIANLSVVRSAVTLNF
jgi:hypothetical protein